MVTDIELRLNNRIDSLENKIDKLINYIESVSPSAPINTVPSCLFSEWLKKWYQVYKEPKLKPSTLRVYKLYIFDIIIPALGKYKLNELDGLKLQEFLNNIPPLNTRKKIGLVINGSLGKAYKLRMIQYNPYDAVETPAKNTKHYIPLSFDMQNKLLQKIGDSIYTSVLWFMCCTGVRIGEFTAIDFKKDISFSNKEILINKSKDLFTGEIDTPKTENSIRLIPFTKTLIPHIRRLREYQTTGKTFTYAMISCYFKRVYKKLGLKGLNLHSFRHTFVSLCYYCGIREKYIQKIVGHATIDMTLNTYTHLLKQGNSPINDYILELKKVL